MHEYGQAVGDKSPQRLFVFSGGFVTQRRIRRILKLSGYDIKLGLPGPDDLVGVWGQSPTAHRGEDIAKRRQSGIVRVEDAFLRSLYPGRKGEPPVGLMVDHSGVHFDASIPSDLEKLLATHPLGDAALMTRARASIARLKQHHLSKYTAFDPTIVPPEPGYVVVIDQTRGDASVAASKASRAQFLEMLVFAQEENPGARVLIKTHPETREGLRAGYFTDDDCNHNVSLFDTPISPWTLFDGAVGVYTMSSQMGFEAILAGHNPRVFGQPFYAGWGLTRDENPVPRRERKLTRAQLFAASMILYPKWYDPYRDRLCEIEDVISNLAARSREWREDYKGWTASGMRLWKRKPLQNIFGSVRPIVFQDAPQTDTAQTSDRREMVWAGKAPAGYNGVRVEDGFLRSKGLGANLVPPLSLVCDDLGIYYDPQRPSRLERLIAASTDLRPDQLRRAENLIASLTTRNITKYNLAGARLTLPNGYKILVPGQVEDDASILTGSSGIQTNSDLLARARAENPDAIILYKPHPDVEAGLRKGEIDNALTWADMVLDQADTGDLFGQVDEVWTMTSLMGFEALLRGLKVTTVGAPFYAGWGLTRDLGDIPPRRRGNVPIQALVHATLIAYPRYFDPVTGKACPVEVIVERLANGTDLPSSAGLRLLSKLQGIFASHAHRWR